MANNSKMTKSASVEDLRDRQTQLEAQVQKLSDEMQEVIKRQEENSRSIDNKLDNLSLMLEKTLKQVSAKNSIPAVGESGNVVRNQGKRMNFVDEGDGVEPEFEVDLTSDEFNFVNSCKKERDNVLKTESRRGTHYQLPRMEFPRFDGGDPKMWKMNCEYYFDLYDVPELYKSKLAILNFSEEVHEWYQCLNRRGSALPWDILVEEVIARFKGPNQKSPIEEFKRVHQVGKVEDFIRKFDRVKTRLSWEKPELDEEFFVIGFISGLKEEIRHTVEMFKPRELNSAFEYALMAKASQESQLRRPKELSKGYNFQKKPIVNQRSEVEKKVYKDSTMQKPWQQNPN